MPVKRANDLGEVQKGSRKPVNLVHHHNVQLPAPDVLHAPGSITSTSFPTQVRHYRLSGASGWGTTLGNRAVITVDCLDPLGKANELQRVDAARGRLHPSGIQLTATDNTTLTFTYTGTDGVERSGTLTLS